MAGTVVRFLRVNLVGLLALFVALGGTSLAAASFIDGKQIRPNSIPKNRLTKGAIKSLKGNQGPQGPPGPAQLRYIVSDPFQSPPLGNESFGSVTCPANEYVTGGGVDGTPGGDNQQHVNNSYPFKNPDTALAPNAWGATMSNSGGNADTFRVYAICTTPSSVISFGPTRGPIARR